MGKQLTLTAALAAYGAQLKNTRWACSAIASDGSLVLSCWRHLMKSYIDGHKRYEDHLSRWIGAHHGKQLLKNHLSLAVEEDLPVRLVIATLDDPRERTDGDASAIKKTFSIHQDAVGKVVDFDGDSFAIEFK